MRFLMSQQLVGSVIYIAANDGAYFVVWGDEVVGVAQSVGEALDLASAGPLRRAGDTEPLSFLKVSRDPSRWVIFQRGLSYDPEGERRRSGGRSVSDSYVLSVAKQPAPPALDETDFPAKPARRTLRGRTPMERLALLDEKLQIVHRCKKR